jgi:predicted nucleic acid-binding protein
METKLILCDTNIFIAWFRGDKDTLTRLETIGLENLLIPSVTIMELFKGIRNEHVAANTNTDENNFQQHVSSISPLKTNYLLMK